MSQTSCNNRGDKIKKGVFVVAGTVSLGLGAVGVILPILPTTPFLLLSAACYYKGSDRIHRWLLNNRLFGSYIRNYRDGKGISQKSKIFTLLLLWTTMGYSIFFIMNNYVFQISLLIISIAVTAHIITLPTFRRS